MTQMEKEGLGIDDIIGDKRDEVIALAAKRGARNVRVFGSVARGEARVDSDIDLLVDQDWTRLSGWGGMQLVVELEELLGRKVDVATEDELHPRLKTQVQNEAVAL